jgi:hypothetical protein
MGTDNGTTAAKEPIVRTEIPEVPDFFGRQGKVQTVAALIEQAQSQLEHFRVSQILNGHADDDEIPGPPGMADVPTYAERRKQLEEGIAQLWEDSADIHEELIREARKRQAQRDLAEASQ